MKTTASQPWPTLRIPPGENVEIYGIHNVLDIKLMTAIDVSAITRDKQIRVPENKLHKLQEAERQADKGRQWQHPVKPDNRSKEG
jgi:hypothetical protein